MSCESKQGVRVIWTLPECEEIKAMRSNDKVVDMSGPWAAERQRLSRQADRQRESLAMLSEDLVLFEKLFLCVQLDPVSGNREEMPWSESRFGKWPCLNGEWVPFADLEAALTWLRAPSVTDPQIAKIYGGLQSFQHWQFLSPILSLLPGNTLLMRELDSRRTECPRWMVLWLSLASQSQRWGYMDAQAIRQFKPKAGRMFMLGEWFEFWKRQPFPWVAMPQILAHNVAWLRSRTAAIEKSSTKSLAKRTRPVQIDDDDIYGTLANWFPSGSGEDDDLRELDK